MTYNSIPSVALKKIISFIHTNLEYYAKIKDSDTNKLIDFLSKINKLYNTDLNIYKIIELRNVYMYVLSKNKGVLTNKYGDNIIEDFNNKISIIDIAKKYNLPPINVLQQILIELKIESHEIPKLLNNEKKLPNVLSNQLTEVLSTDPKILLPNKPIQVITYIYKTINKMKIKIVNTSISEKNIPTMILDKLCTYKNISFNWIEIKSYLLFDNDYLLHDANKFISKCNKYGIGLILYPDIICTKKFIKKINAPINTFLFFS